MKKSKEKSDKSTNKTFPGYPLYTSSEDIIRDSKRVPLDGDGNAILMEEEILADASNATATNDSDLTEDDLQALGPVDLSLDMGEDEELLKQRTEPVDFTGAGLDIPGSELDDASEEVGSEDEENNSYSIGGDAKDNLEERKD